MLCPFDVDLDEVGGSEAPYDVIEPRGCYLEAVPFSPIVTGEKGVMENVPLPFVEPAILASVVALALLVALAVDLPVSVGAGILALFALFHAATHAATN